MLKFFSGRMQQIPHLRVFLSEEEERQVLIVAGWGHKPTADKARRYAREKGLAYLAVEDGFLRSLRPGVEGSAPLSLTVDPVGVYYDASGPSRFEELVQAHEAWFSDAVRERAARGMALLRAYDLSKYNDAPSMPRGWIRSYFGVAENARVVLVVDQTKGDASLTLGRADEAALGRMVSDAVSEHPGALVLLKPHPDVLAGKKASALGAWQSDARIKMLTDRWAPLGLLSEVDEVYTATSQMGFEALLLGKTVHVYGEPFYAGWGLTDDRAGAPERRSTQATPELLFAAAYFELCRYVNPVTGERTTFEETAVRLAAERRENEMRRRSFVAVGFRRWKKPHARAFLSGTGSSVEFLWDIPEGLQRARDTGSTAVIWAGKCTDEVVAKAAAMGVPLWRMEDGFIRSIGLGSDYYPPGSLVLDDEGIYYDPARPSRLETILKTIRGRPDHDALCRRAEALAGLIVQNGISKYNLKREAAPDWVRSLPRDRKILLVPGQVDDDASVRRGGGAIQSSRALLEAVRAGHPGDFIVFKPHPDVVSGNRVGNIPPDELRRLADFTAPSGAIEALLPYVDEVHTLTSLSGFEALLRGVRTETYGRPFYAGWGLTVDHMAHPDRGVPLTLPELVAGALILYPSYWDWMTARFCLPEDVCWRILRGEQLEPPLWVRACRVIRDVRKVFPALLDRT